MKHCKSCNTEKNESDFYMNKARSDGLDVYCKECHSTKVKQRRDKYRSRILINEPAKKICKSCNIEKDNVKFHKTKTNPDGLSNHCKACTGIRFRTDNSIRKDKEAERYINIIEWKPVPSLDNLYLASRCGQILSVSRTRTRSNGRVQTIRQSLIKQYIDSKGYLQFRAYTNSGKRTIRAHRAVYEAWKGPLSSIEDVDHMDNNPVNNHIDNLQAVNRKTHSGFTRERIFDRIREEAYERGHKAGYEAALKQLQSIKERGAGI